MAELLKAAFFRVEGALCARPRVAAPAWFTLNSQEITPRLTRLGGVALATGMNLVSPLQRGPAAQRLAWMGLRGMSEDRLAVLGGEYYEQHVLPHLKPIALDLLTEARRRGDRIVLISELLEHIVAPLRAHLGADTLLANRAELRNGVCTGRLEEPVIGGAISGQWARSWAREHQVDLEASAAYGARASDSLLLSAIGNPCAIDPDWRLRRIARDHRWPVVDQ